LILHEQGVPEVVVGDMSHPSVLADACFGVESIYLICPNMSGAEPAIGRTAIAAAKRCGVPRLVYHSVLHPQTHDMPHHLQKLQVEEALFKSGLAYTILQPGPYMQNLLAQFEQIADKGILSAPYSTTVRFGMIDLFDFGEAAVQVFQDETHFGATYELVGQVLSLDEAAEFLSEVLGRDVRAKKQPLLQWKRSAVKGGMESAQMSWLAKMFRYYDRFGLEGNPSTLTWLLGRRPGSFTDLAARWAARSGFRPAKEQS
jgi:uncharacterized protein YbjT (DUF2867 family)